MLLVKGVCMKKSVLKRVMLLFALATVILFANGTTAKAEAKKIATSNSFSNPVNVPTGETFASLKKTGDDNLYYFAFTTPNYKSFYTNLVVEAVHSRVDIALVNAGGATAGADLFSTHIWERSTGAYVKKLKPNTKYIIRIKNYSLYTAADGASYSNVCFTLTHNKDNEGTALSDAIKTSENRVYKWKIDWDEDEDYAEFTATKSGKYLIQLTNASSTRSGVRCSLKKKSTD